MEEHSPFEGLQRSLEKLAEPAGMQEFRSALEEPFRAALDSKAAVGWLAREVRELAVEPTTVPGRASGSPSTISSGPWGRVALTHVSRPSVPSEALVSSPRHVAIGLLKGPLDIRRYRHQKRSDPALRTHDDVLTIGGDETLGEGDVLWLEAGHDVIEVRSGTGALLAAESAPIYTIRWVYDRETRCPRAMIAAETHLGRLEDGLRLLSQIGDEQHIDAVETLAGHESHSVRWAAIRAAMAIDQERGLRLLKAASDDQHPHVRRAARRALTSTESAQV